LWTGFPNISKEGDFIYTDYYNSSFMFEGTGCYLKYQIIFQSDTSQYLSPSVDNVVIYYILENPKPSIQITNH